MLRHRSHSVDFKRQVAQELLSAETLHGLAKYHDRSRNLIRIWVNKSFIANRAAWASRLKSLIEHGLQALNKGGGGGKAHQFVVETA